MDLSICLVTYSLLFLIIFVILLKIGKDVMSSFIISVALGLVYLLVVFPPYKLRIDTEDASYSALYSFILIVSIFICVIYSGVTAAMTTNTTINNTTLKSK